MNEEVGDCELLRTGEAAALVGVSTRTLKRYEQQGRVRARRTPSGHRRFAVEDLRPLLTPARGVGSGDAA